MSRWMLAATAFVLLAACDQNGPGRTAIANRCVAGGEAAEICKCLADASSNKLEPDLFQVVVLGAQGEEAQTEKLVKELPPESQAKFSSTMRDIIQGCGAEGYVAAN
ncbi:MAG: hypothetical protein Q8R02_05325 [Hyphomonadaceae bacterium]|nr:hypothetical protein [Hyphomonadaceae bacterium]